MSPVISNEKTAGTDGIYLLESKADGSTNNADIG
jgi:hypothetical protein